MEDYRAVQPGLSMLESGIQRSSRSLASTARHFFADDRRKMETILTTLSTSSYPIRILLDAGTLDPELNYAKRFEGFLTKDSIEHSWDNPSGTHSEAYWRENLEMYLEEYSRDW